MNQLVAALGVLVLAGAASASDTADREIRYLISYVSESGCTFERNGSDHPSADAAEHLELKYRRGARYADTAEHFIDRLASESSWSGRPYTVTCAGHTEPSSAWLHRALREYRQDPP